jgi:hypothetical protein
MEGGSFSDWLAGLPLAVIAFGTFLVMVVTAGAGHLDAGGKPIDRRAHQ